MCMNTCRFLIYTVLFVLLGLGSARAADTFSVNGVVYERISSLAFDRDGNIRPAARVYIIQSASKVNIPAEVWDYNNRSFRVVSEVDSRALNTNADVEELTLPYSVTTVLTSAFINCAKLRKVTFESDENWLSPLIIGSQAFDGCKALADVTFPKHLAEIGNYAFRGCSSLTTVHNFEYKSGSKCPLLKKIGSWAFLDCRTLGSASIQKLPKLEEIGLYAFRNTDIRSVHLIPSLKTLGSGAFMDNGNLLSIYTYANTQLTILPSSAFKNCVRLYRFYEYNSSGTSYSEVNYPPRSVQMIQDGAFKGCSALGTSKGVLGLSSQLGYIGEEAFAETGISSLHFDHYVQLKKAAFQNCKSLKKVSFATTCQISAIPESCFEGCSSLADFEIPDYPDLKEIGSRAFYCCTALTAIHLPWSLTAIGADAFHNTPKLASVFCEVIGSPILITADTFTSTERTSTQTAADPTGVLIVTDSKNYSKYSTATGWKRFKNRSQSKTFLECQAGTIQVYY